MHYIQPKLNYYNSGDTYRLHINANKVYNVENGATTVSAIASETIKIYANLPKLVVMDSHGCDIHNEGKIGELVLNTTATVK